MLLKQELQIRKHAQASCSRGVVPVCVRAAMVHGHLHRVGTNDVRIVLWWALGHQLLEMSINDYFPRRPLTESACTKGKSSDGWIRDFCLRQPQSPEPQCAGKTLPFTAPGSIELSSSFAVILHYSTYLGPQAPNNVVVSMSFPFLALKREQGTARCCSPFRVDGFQD